MNLQGIDVSKFQGAINWDSVCQSGVKFVMARASYGKSSRDNTFAANAAGARACGLEVGAYHFCYAETVEQARAEAANFLAAVEGFELTYPLALDLEYNANTAKALSLWSDMAAAFLREIEDAGYFAMLYSDAYSLANRFNKEKIAPFAVWVAQWAAKNTYTGPYGIWQNSSTGSVPGIAGAVDTSICHVDYAGIIKSKGLNRPQV